MTFDLEEARERIASLEPAGAAELRADVEALARPRMTGTDGAAAVELELRTRFEQLGYRPTELGFSFSAWPGRFGLSASGGVLLLGGGLGAGALYTDRLLPALVCLLAGIALALLPLLFLGPAIRALPWGRLRTANLLFQRPGHRPAWIVMAHRDSKSQLVPTLLRTAAIGAAAFGWIALVALALLRFLDPVFHLQTPIAVAGAMVVLSGLVLALSWAGNDSPGALDNASGLAALLAVARRNRDNGDIAFLLTDGEELGLAGARAASTALPPVQGVINVDVLDDRGRFYVAEGSGWRRQASAPQLAAALLSAGQALGLPVQRRPLPRSLLVDHMPLADAGIPALSLVRGRWASLLRVHRPADSIDRLRCDGAAEAATLLAAALRLLREDPTSHLAGGRDAGS